MDYLQILNEIFRLCLVPLLGIITRYLVIYLSAKKNEIVANSNDALETKYVSMLADTINACVIETNQTYVEALKDKNAFDAEAQKAAFNQTYNAVMNILSQDAKDYLQSAYGDLNSYITAQIEQKVNTEKKSSN